MVSRLSLWRDPPLQHHFLIFSFLLLCSHHGMAFPEAEAQNPFCCRVSKTSFSFIFNLCAHSKMCRWSTNSKNLWVPIVVFSLFLGMTQLQCQQMNDYDQIDSPAVLPLLTQLMYSQISNLTSIISQEISRESTFCVKDP